ncbi:MAG: glycosyltransferase family 2 protein [Lamprocystis purpurea]|jgi:glycosyltransferase involved in cell wall biosynthesis|nr:glycosyltransferase family 2 protein [Lamprocystis purpurea]
MMPPSLNSSETHLVLIPSYDSGALVYDVVRAACRQWTPVWVVVDGSTDGTTAVLQEMAATDPGLRVFALPKNSGKGAAILHGLDLAAREGFTHALTMDADGQHPVERIPDFMAASIGAPDAMVLGVPAFDVSAPRLRVQGRKVSNGFANLETLWMGIDDSLCGFRVYPIEPLRQVMHGQRWMRRFDFDPEAVVRLCWRGVRPINLSAPVKYLSADQGGVSHFRYLRDNAQLTWMHARLMLGFLLRFPALLRRRLRAGWGPGV